MRGLDYLDSANQKLVTCLTSEQVSTGSSLGNSFVWRLHVLTGAMSHSSCGVWTLVTIT